MSGSAISQEITDVALDHAIGRSWWIALVGSLGLVGILVGSVGWLLYEGVGVWGNNNPVGWALDIVSYDWWIGVASGGLMVSALLLLMGVEWRGAVNRITETMGLLAAAAAGLYPIIHLGRPWFFYWNLPYPNTFLLWPQFRSPLFWDAVDIISYLVITLSFWYIGMLPDLAAMRDRSVERLERMAGRPGGWFRLLRAQLYGIVALGWRGSIMHWQRWEDTYRILAVFGIVLVVSLQTGAAVMFAGSVEPGWHDVLLPVSFLFAALFAGVAIVSMMMVVLRAAFPLRNLVTTRHLNLLAMLLLGLGLANLYCYTAEFAITALAGSDYDQEVMARRFHGPHAWSTWAIIICGLIPVHLFWLPAARRSSVVLFIVGLLAAFGMWADHFMVIVVTLQHDFLPYAASQPYAIDVVEIASFLGTTGLFMFLLLLFVRYVPVLSVVDSRTLVGTTPVRRG